jgi:hypothetical protein
MTREYDNRIYDVEDLAMADGHIECPDPDCEGRFEDMEIISTHCEAVELEAKCTHCYTKLYLCHEQPTATIIKVPVEEE